MKRWLPLCVLWFAFVRDSGAAPRPLADYRYFRALSIDLIGRPPTRAEIRAFEDPSFDLNGWIDKQLFGDAYAERIRRVYADLLRLALPENVTVFKPPAVLLRWSTIQGPDGRTIDLYYRDGQRRRSPDLDGQVCFTPDESGLKMLADGPPVGNAKPISKQLLEARTVVIKPWWLYADARSRDPRNRANESFAETFGYELVWSLFVEPDGKTPQAGIRVCREEAQTAETGRVMVTGRSHKKGDPIPPNRVTRAPSDTAFAKANAGKPVSCLTHAGFETSSECGCGAALERCVPTWPNGFVMPWQSPLGVDHAFETAARPAVLWHRAWWSEEANHFFDRVFREDRDVREMLTSRSTVINGPLAQFYRYLSNATYYGAGQELGYTQPVPLFEPARVPKTLAPHQVAWWTPVEDRGPRAAGVLTMPIFLLKYGSRRQRAHAVYNTFLCKEFVAENIELKASNEPDLTKRTGCANCHRKLEPMAAYFARIQESDWTYLPPSTFPATNASCGDDPQKWSLACKTFYDADFRKLRGVHNAPEHAELGPPGFAAEVTSSPEFAPCVVKNVAQSLLGRQLAPEDAAWKASLAKKLVESGYRMRTLVKAIVTSPQYRDTSDRVTQ